MNQRDCFLAFNRINQVGPRTVLKLLAYWPDLTEVFKQSTKALLQVGLNRHVAEAITCFTPKTLKQDWLWQEKSDHLLITWQDEVYPSLLKETYDPPMVLYAKGDIRCLNAPSVAVVGSRHPSPTGSETAKRLAYQLAQHNLAIVSGLAIGIDGQAHQGCLEAQGKTIAVMATGMDRIYPLRHRKLAEQIVENGLLLTEFPLGTQPIAGHFPRRNRIISGLTLATLVVEAAIKSGSLITARMALEQNRDVFAVPGSIYNPKSRGCHYLVQQGAKLVTTCEDMLNELGLEIKRYADKTAHSSSVEMSNLVAFIGFEVTTIDQMMDRSGWSFEAVTTDLSELELQGIVKTVPGGYMRCV